MPEPISPAMEDILALSLVPNLGPRLTAALTKHFGSAAAIRKATASQLRQVPQIGDKLAEQFAAALRSVNVAREIELIQKHGVGLLALGDPGYPAALATIGNAPPLLYYRGKLTDADTRAVGIVGSRQCTAYGRRMAERIATGLARAGWTVVSGLARGIDGVAHRAALAAGGRTIAVLAGGLSEIYPPEHADLAREIESAGCILTETPMTVEPLPGMFPARNRIISALSRGVVVVEAPERSGALITATHAVEQGREVFAVPGNADSDGSQGTLKLIRQGARLVRSADDILEDLAGISPPVSAATTEAPKAPPLEPPQLDDTQRNVWQQLAGGSRHIDDLVRATGIDVAKLNGILMMLEMKKVVRRLPGNVYERR